MYFSFIYPLQDLLEMSDIQPTIKALIQRCLLTVALIFAYIVLMDEPLHSLGFIQKSVHFI